eukprot:9208098-Alexandrium_andersonii.AAC.1
MTATPTTLQMSTPVWAEARSVLEERTDDDGDGDATRRDAIATTRASQADPGGPQPAAPSDGFRTTPCFAKKGTWHRAVTVVQYT